MPPVLTSRVPPNFHQHQLVDYLSARFTYRPRWQWRAWIEEGRLRVNGELLSPDTRVNRNDTVTFESPVIDEPPADLRIRIVYQDEWLVGVNKPGNLLVHRAGRSFTSNLVYQLRFNSGDDSLKNASPVHRLDRETSGVVVVAKTTEAMKALSHLWTIDGVRKEYVAIVHGTLQESPVVIDQPIGRDTSSAVDYKWRVDQAAGKTAQTRVEMIRPLGDGFSLVRAMPMTGRTHQIRVHFASVGCPVVGDKLYSVPEDEYLRWRADPDNVDLGLLLDRQALHCASMTFEHPMTKQRCAISAELPEDMAELVARLEGPLLNARLDTLPPHPKWPQAVSRGAAGALDERQGSGCDRDPPGY